MNGLISCFAWLASYERSMKPKSDAMHSKGRRRPNRVLLSAEEEALIAGGPRLRQSRPIINGSEPRPSGERPPNLGIKAKRGE